MDSDWFVFIQGEVRGPFQKPDIEAMKSQWPQMFVWGQGLQQWLPPSQWLELLEQGHTRVANTAGTTGSNDGTTGAGGAATSNQRVWKLKIDNHEMKDLTYSQMMDVLKSRDEFENVRIWTEGYTDWREIYQIHQIADELGVSRRKHPRVPVMGSVQCENNQGQQFELRALSLSEGGLGASGGHSLHIGDRLKVVLKSPNLFTPIHATAEIVYVGPDGYVGMKFLGIQIESKSSILEYVRKFQEEHTQTGIRPG